MALSKIKSDSIDTIASTKLTGTIADARFPATLPVASGVNLTNLDARDLENALPALDASSLTSIPAANITGTLPAIDGSSLTGVGVDGITSSANATAISISADEEVTMPLQPYYLAWGGNQPNSVGTGGYLSVTWTGRIDTGSNVSSNTFTAPVTGKYLICASVHIENLTTAATAVSAAIVTSNRTYGNFEYSPGSLDLHTYHTVHQSVVADMDAADTAYINCRVADMSSNTADVGSGNGYHWWTVTLIT